MPDFGSLVWLFIAVCAFIAGFFVGKRHGIALEQKVGTIKEKL